MQFCSCSLSISNTILLANYEEAQDVKRRQLAFQHKVKIDTYVGFSVDQQQILMINYRKGRESVEKNFSKKSLGKGISVNKSHTSSINIKLTQDCCPEPLKTIFKDKTEVSLSRHYQPLQPSQQPLQQSQQKKHSVKLQEHEKENPARRKDNLPYDVTIFRPFQETNRYLETERIQKDYKNSNQRTPGKQPLKLRTQYQDQKQLRTDYTEATPQKLKKESSTKHTTENEKRVMRISTQDLKGLVDQLIRQQKDVAGLRRELQFYRTHAAKDHFSPILHALKV